MHLEKYFIGLVIGVLVILAFFVKEPTTIYAPKVYVRRIPAPAYDTMPFAGVCTLMVAHPTPVASQADSTRYEIPTWHWRFDDSLIFIADNGRPKDYRLPFRLHVWGFVKRYDIEQQPFVVKLDPGVDKNMTLWKIGAIGFGVVSVALIAKVILD